MGSRLPSEVSGGQKSRNRVWSIAKAVCNTHHRSVGQEEVAVPFKRNKSEVMPPDTATDSAPAPVVSNGASADVAREPALVGAGVGETGGGYTSSAQSQPAVASPEKLAGVSRGRLGNLLIERNLVTEQQLDQGVATQHECGGERAEAISARSSSRW